MKRILITGLSGFIGSHTLEHFLKTTDWEIIGIVSFRHKGNSQRIADINAFDLNRVKLYYHDLAGPLGNTLEARIGKVDYIVNMAAESHVDRSIDEPVPFVKNNVDLTLNMLEYSRKANPDMFIQVSTDEVYGPAPEGENFKEWAAIVPSNPYSASKAAQEAIAISYWRTYGVPLVITNTMNNIGERQDVEKFVPLVIQKVLNDEVVPIHGSTNSIGSRFYLHARNHADAIKFIIENLPAKMYPEVEKPDRYNVVGEQELNNLELAEMIAEIIGKPLKYELIDFHAARPGHDRRYALDGSLLKSKGWKPPISLEESLKRMIKWTMENPEWLT